MQEQSKKCSKCKTLLPLSEFSPRADRPTKYLSACKSCRAVYYKQTRSPRTTLKHNSKEESLRWNKEKRDKRTKNAFLLKTDEFNQFFLKEIHLLRKIRDNITGLKWHVDHILPLRNSKICGLHYWHNLQLLPAVINWSKNNAFYD